MQTNLAEKLDELSVEPASNIVELEAIVAADGGWFLDDVTETRWTNKTDIHTARRFPISVAYKFVKAYSQSGSMKCRFELVV